MGLNNFFNTGKIFDLPKGKSNIIKVIGVGGGGSNAVNYMFQEGIKGVDYAVCNTDAQALEYSPVPNKIQLGINLTEGLGAGADPSVGEKAAQESIDEIRKLLEVNTQMVFITAGMGGGTGTGASPVIAQIAKELGILTVGIVTYPFSHEGPKKRRVAEEGIRKLRESVDSLIVINNNKLVHIYGDLGIKESYAKANEVLLKGAKGMAEVISNHYIQNIDLRDARTVLENGGTAIMGVFTAEGENRAIDAVTGALNSPLLNDNKITGAKNVLLLVVFGKKQVTGQEIDIISNYIQSEAGDNMADIILGIGEDENLGESISVTVVATGFDANQQQEITGGEAQKVIHILDDSQPITHDLTEQVKPVINQQSLWKEGFPTPTPPTPQPTTPTTPTTEVKKNDVSKSDLFNMWVDHEVLAPEKAFRIVEQPKVISNSNNENTVNQVVIPAQQVAKEKSVVLELSDSPRAGFAYLADRRDMSQSNENDEIRLVLRDYDENSNYFERSNEITFFTSNEFDRNNLIEGQQMSMFNEQEERPTHLDPINNKISEVMAKRSGRLQEYNHKFKPSNGYENNQSRMSVGRDSSGDFQIRKNNPYLHDNVD